MNTLLTSHSPVNLSASTRRPPIMGGVRFDGWLSLVYLFLISGGYLDAWAHQHGRVDDSFFTPWHGVMYSGLLLVLVVMVGVMLINRYRGASWQTLLPQGYQRSWMGAMLFAVGGVGDLIWHELFGIEKSFDALFSPTHLVLGVAFGLLVSGPLRAAWARPGRLVSWANLWPALLSLTCLISTFTLLMIPPYPLSGTLGSLRPGDLGEVGGPLGILVVAALLVGPILLAVRRWQLPPGSLLLVWGINMIAMQMISWQVDSPWLPLVAMLLGAAVVEGIRLWLQPSANQPTRFHLFGFLAPVLLFGCYFAALVLSGTMQWSIHKWTGTTFLAGVAGWLLSYLIVPPAWPEE